MDPMEDSPPSLVLYPTYGGTFRIITSGVYDMKQSPGFIVTAVAAAVASHMGAAAAQGASQPSASELAEITVTGSRIQSRIDEQPAPVMIATVEELKEFSPGGLEDAVKDLPALAQSTGRNGSGGPGTNIGQTYINMRGLGTTRSLVLMNGHRLVGSQASGEFDVSLIPQQLVKQVEVVTGGASAAYGSDAIAGVTNFILETRFEGVKGTASAGISRYSDDQNQRASLAFGHSFLGERLHVIGSVDLMSSEGAQGFASGGPRRGWATERRFLIQNPNATQATKSPDNPLYLAATDARYPFQTNGGMISSGPLSGLQFLPNGVVAPFQYGTLRTAQQMSGGDGGSSGGTWSLDMPTHSRVAFAHAEYDLKDNVTLYAEGQYSKASTSADTGTVYSSGPTAITIYRGNPFLPESIQQRMVNENIPSFKLGRLNMDFGLYSRHITNKMQRFEVGAKGTLGDGWSWDAFYEYGSSDNDAYFAGGNSIAVNLFRAADAVRDGSGNIVCSWTLTHPGDSCVPINLLGEGSPSKEALDYVLGEAYALTHVNSKILSAELTGQLGATWAGPLKVAAGFTHRDDSFVEDTDPLGYARQDGTGIRGFPASLQGTYGLYQFGNVNPGSGGLNVSELFGEVLVPLLADQPGARILNLDLAGRFTKYSTVGGVYTWKAGLTYNPVESLRLRANLSHDIRAPGLDALYMTAPTGNLSVTDTIDGSNRITPAQIQSPGNPDLKEETAKTITYGVVFTPTWLRGLNASIDYYNIKIDGAIGRVVANTIIDLCRQGDPEMCGLITRIDGAIAVIRTPALNMSTLETAGIDVALGYSTLLPMGQLSFRADANFVNKELTISKAGTRNDTVDGTPTRMNLSANYRVGNFGFGVREQMIGSRMFNTTYTTSDVANPYNPAFWYTDLNFTWQQPNNQGDIQWFANINNLMDKDPPTAQGIMAGARNELGLGIMYRLVGRTYTAGVRFRF